MLDDEPDNQDVDDFGKGEKGRVEKGEKEESGPAEAHRESFDLSQHAAKTTMNTA
jgi:hypothetical protein